MRNTDRDKNNTNKSTSTLIKWIKKIVTDSGGHGHRLIFIFFLF